MFDGCFDSVLVDQNCAIAKMMAYITLIPVRAGIVVEPAEYRWSGYAERMACGKLQDNDYRAIVGNISRKKLVSAIRFWDRDIFQAMDQTN